MSRENIGLSDNISQLREKNINAYDKEQILDMYERVKAVKIPDDSDSEALIADINFKEAMVELIKDLSEPSADSPSLLFEKAIYDLLSHMSEEEMYISDVVFMERIYKALFNQTLKEMPLLMNCTSLYMRAIIQWRLDNGR